MADNWDDSDDDWDVDDDDELDARLGLKESAPKEGIPQFDDEEDLALKDREEEAKASHQSLKKKGNALLEKKKAEEKRKEDEEIARKAMELELEMESKMSVEDRRKMERQRVEDADNALTEDLFGVGPSSKPARGATAASDDVVMKDLKDHLRHAQRVAKCIKGHGKTAFALTFLKECIQECKDVLDDTAISELVKTCNIIKNEKVQAAKRKVKGQAQKSKRDKAAEERAKQLQKDLYGDNDKYDMYDEYGEDYEDAFF
mmetsp:Transcript_16850/g.25748  ORF Transcript_16850/g.25748 Transcript_16850/m.25748 type:complete len:259 (+) Transcript_16850:137-913(+)|eukprot:CAMPEP_0118684724 /NCGR_PEP_ID=MMETSP0800-20121206/6821_1 /TAXON_ID=210618 ORGANISM="Striatella unipunctata, Strain CCMP2910" /NCGR_SAMPLE_ID=MMETSP0800 /ASSEMBLY_ACC=CAM_ASM_000638 /LENGTH=258 /DNA_ID=CAMNT_0006581499 /DNA_START=102 /DNA_END=878 /DNA_ORIENTATION=-